MGRGRGGRFRARRTAGYASTRAGPRYNRAGAAGYGMGRRRTLRSRELCARLVCDFLGEHYGSRGIGRETCSDLGRRRCIAHRGDSYQSPGKDSQVERRRRRKIYRPALDCGRHIGHRGGGYPGAGSHSPAERRRRRARYRPCVVRRRRVGHRIRYANASLSFTGGKRRGHGGDPAKHGVDGGRSIG